MYYVVGLYPYAAMVSILGDICIYCQESFPLACGDYDIGAAIWLGGLIRLKP
jgi:hypothetical protein